VSFSRTRGNTRALYLSVVLLFVSLVDPEVLLVSATKMSVHRCITSTADFFALKAIARTQDDGTRLEWSRRARDQPARDAVDPELPCASLHLQVRVRSLSPPPLPTDPT